MLLGLYYFIAFLYCPNSASGLQYRNKRIVTTAKRMKIHVGSHCQRGNCCAMQVLFNDV